MTIAEDLFEQAKMHSECYRAGVLAGDASGRSAQKLAAAMAALQQIADINNGPDKASGEWRCGEAAAIAQDTLNKLREP